MPRLKESFFKENILNFNNKFFIDYPTFVETGTNKGLTALLASKLLFIPVAYEGHAISFIKYGK